MDIEQVIYEMLAERTAISCLDSGGAYGRHWERNQKKSLSDFKNEPSVSWDEDYYIISVFHYLINGLELNSLCNEFNNMSVKDWDSTEFYGVSKDGEDWIKDRFAVDRTFNSYNGESALSQVIQGTWLNLDNKKYLLLQIHQGCDVRGGYTDARLFYVPNYWDGSLSEGVYGEVTKENGEIIQVDNRYNGYSLTDENGKEVKIMDKDKVELWLANDTY